MRSSLKSLMLGRLLSLGRATACFVADNAAPTSWSHIDSTKMIVSVVMLHSSIALWKLMSFKVSISL